MYTYSYPGKLNGFHPKYSNQVPFKRSLNRISTIPEQIPFQGIKTSYFSGKLHGFIYLRSLLVCFLATETGFFGESKQTSFLVILRNSFLENLVGILKKDFLSGSRNLIVP